jgi:hypothetical protein
MLINSEIESKELSEIIKNYKYDDLNNLKICISEMKIRGKDLNQKYLNEIVKYYNVSNISELTNNDLESSNIDIVSYKLKKRYFFIGKSTIIFWLITFYILNTIYPNVISFKSPNNMLYPLYFSYIVSIGFFKSDYKKYYKKYNAILLCFLLVLIINIIQLLIGQLVFKQFFN